MQSKHHRRKPDLPISRAWVVPGLAACNGFGLEGQYWALLLGGGYWLPVLHFHSEISAAYMKAAGGERALGDAVLHTPWRIERLVDVDVTDVSVGRSLARAEICNVDPVEKQKKRQALGQQRGRRGRGRLAST